MNRYIVAVKADSGLYDKITIPAMTERDAVEEVTEHSITKGAMNDHDAFSKIIGTRRITYWKFTDNPQGQK